MLPDLRFAVSAVLASTLLIVTALGLAATVRVAHLRAAGPGDSMRTLAYADPVDWGRFFVEQRPIAAMRADAPAVDGALPERAPEVVPDANAPATVVIPDAAVPPLAPDTMAAAAIAPDEPIAAVVEPDASAAVAANPAVVPDKPVAPPLQPDAVSAATAVPDTTAVAPAVPDTNKATVIAPKAQAAAVAAPDIDVTGSIGTGAGVRAAENIDVGKPVKEVKALDRAEPVAVFDPPPETTGLITPSFKTQSPGAESESGTFEPALEPSERVIGLPAFPNAGPGFVPPHDIALPAPLPRSKPAAKPEKKAARRRVRARPAVAPPLATTGYPLPGDNTKWFAD